MTVRRLLSPLVLIAVLATIVAGCGTTIAPGPSLTSFTAAATASAASDTGKFELKLEQSLPGTDKSFGFSAGGSFDTPNERAQLTVDLSALAELLAGFGKSLGGAIKGDLSTDPDDWKLEAIQDGSTVYVRFPLVSKELPDGKSWIKGDAKEFAGAGGAGLGQFGSFAGTDPREAFSYLKAVSGAIETVGGEKIRGTETTHYRATMDAAKAAELVPPDQRQGLGNLDAMLGQAGMSAIPLDVWLDAEQRVRKLEISLSVTAPGTTEEARTAMTMELYDYGEPVDLPLPPADEVADVATLKQTGS
jgi:hypothetical protein